MFRSVHTKNQIPMLRQKITILLLCLCFSVTLAQTPGTVLQEAKPEDAGVSSAELKQLDQLMQEYVNEGYIPSATALIARNGKVIYHKSVGHSDAEAKKKLDNTAIFRIASQTKAVTSVGVMLLFEEGKFRLDDPVSKYLPAFKNMQVLDQFNASDTTFTTVPAKREITIQDLLTHTSGISYPGIGSQQAVAIYAKHKIPSGIGTSTDLKLATAMNALAKLPLVHQPGERFTYGLNTDVLGYLIEVLSGKPLDVFFQERIFTPLGMKDTYFNLPAGKQNRLVKLYTENKDKKTIPADKKNSFRLDPDYPKGKSNYFSGGAGLSSTVYDYAVFLQMLLNGGAYNGKRILSPATVRLMTSNQIGEVNQGDNKFGLGFGIVTEKGAARTALSVDSYEWGGIFGTTYWIDPKEGIIALLYTNKYPNSYGDLGNKFKKAVYETVLEPQLENSSR